MIDANCSICGKPYNAGSLHVGDARICTSYLAEGGIFYVDAGTTLVEVRANPDPNGQINIQTTPLGPSVGGNP